MTSPSRNFWEKLLILERNPGRFGPGSFQPRSFLPNLGVGRFGLGRWVDLALGQMMKSKGLHLNSEDQKGKVFYTDSFRNSVHIQKN